MNVDVDICGLRMAVARIMSENPEWGRSRIATAIGAGSDKVRRAMDYVRTHREEFAGTDTVTKGNADRTCNTALDENEGRGTVITRAADIKTVQDAMEYAEIDTDVWEAYRSKINKYGTAMREPATTVGGRGDKALVVENDDGGSHTLWTRGDHVPKEVTIWQVCVWVRRKAPGEMAIKDVLEEMKSLSPSVPARQYPKPRKTSSRRALEIDLFDAHLGMVLSGWSMEQAQDMIWRTVHEIARRVEKFAPFCEVVIPLGNDWGHIDSIFGTTTAGTNQPEAMSLRVIMRNAFRLGIDIVSFLSTLAPVTVKIVPGNHDQMLTYAMGFVLEAHFHADKNVTVDNSDSTYKFWRFGRCLCMYEHGHSIKPVRFASLMATECPGDFAETKFREVHCGDQHRAGRSGLVSFEEFGVAPEFFAGLTPTNEWHKIKSFKNQIRNGYGIVWNHEEGREATLPVWTGVEG